MKKHDSNTIWAVRDARGLSANEKVFLFVVASRGVMKTTRETALEDMGFKKDTFYKVQKSLADRGLIKVTPGQYNPVSGKRDHTHYEVIASALQKDDSVSQKDDSVSQKDDSVEPDNKGNREDNREGNKEDEAVANAPASLPLTDTKEDAETSKKTDLPSLTVEEEPAVFDVEEPRHGAAEMTEMEKIWARNRKEFAEW